MISRDKPVTSRDNPMTSRDNTPSPRDPVTRPLTLDKQGPHRPLQPASSATSARRS